MKMIALVSDQRMQNIIPLFQKDMVYTNLTLVLSKDRNTGKPLKKYVDSANDLNAVLASRVSVEASEEYIAPYDISDARQTIYTLIHSAGNPKEIVVNISGGTKPMAIGALQAAQAANVKSLYTDTENGEIIWLSPGGTIDTQTIQIEGLDVAAYIRAYGEEIASFNRVEDLDSKYIQWAKVIAENHKIIYKKVINPVNTAIKKAHKEKKGFPVNCVISPTRKQRGVVQQLAKLGLWSWSDASNTIIVLDKNTAHFLNGGWVELYTGVQIEESGFFDDVLLNVTLKGIDGELDLVAISNGKLVLVECKSNVQRSEQLNKLDGFRRRLGGPFAKAYYARASDAYQRQIRQQCQKIRLNDVYFGAELCSMGKKIGRNIGAIE